MGLVWLNLAGTKMVLKTIETCAETVSKPSQCVKGPLIYVSQLVFVLELQFESPFTFQKSFFETFKIFQEILKQQFVTNLFEPACV